MAKLKESVLGSGLRGSSGSVVFVRQPGGGTIVREKPLPNDPRTEVQEAWRNLVRRASAAWRNLTPTQSAAWYDYAATLAQEKQQGSVSPSALYIGLAAKRWQYDALAAAPTSPPVQTFTGDGVVITVSSELGVGVRFTASGPNSVGVATELLLQRLTNPSARPQTGKDRHKAFATFTPSHLNQTVSVEPGFYACSVRFLQTATGQTSALVRVGVVVAS